MIVTLPEVDWGGVGSSQEAGQQGSCSISSWRHRHPTPAEASPILLVSPTLQAGLPVQRPSQSQAELWFISAAPAASLSLLVNRGSRQGRAVGGGGMLLWATSGFRAFLVPVPIFLPRKLGSGLPT